MRVLAVGLLIAVASLTTVAFFADRVRQALSSRQASFQVPIWWWCRIILSMIRCGGQQRD
jgi:hypothetical protein